MVVALMAVIAACGESPTQTADDGPATEGDGSRSAVLLRFDPAAGDSRSTRMTMDMAMELTLDGEQAPGVELPETGMTMDITVDEVDEQIDLSFDYRDLQASGGEEQVRQQVQQALAGMEGMSGTVSLTPRAPWSTRRSMRPPRSIPP